MDELIDCVFLDCQKNFDTVPHRGWMTKLDIQARVRGRLLKWIDSHLIGGEQTAHLGNLLRLGGSKQGEQVV